MAQQILNEADLARIQEGLAAAEKAIYLAEQAKQAGLPVDTQLEKATNTRAQLLRMKQTFFPGQ